MKRTTRQTRGKPEQGEEKEYVSGASALGGQPRLLPTRVSRVSKLGVVTDRPEPRIPGMGGGVKGRLVEMVSLASSQGVATNEEGHSHQNGSMQLKEGHYQNPSRTQEAQVSGII